MDVPSGPRSNNSNFIVAWRQSIYIATSYAATLTGFFKKQTIRSTTSCINSAVTQRNGTSCPNLPLRPPLSLTLYSTKKINIHTIHTFPIVLKIVSEKGGGESGLYDRSAKLIFGGASHCSSTKNKPVSQNKKFMPCCRQKIRNSTECNAPSKWRIST